MVEQTRRSFLAIATMMAVPLAGCTGDDDDGEEQTPTPTPSPTPSPTETPTPTPEPTADFVISAEVPDEVEVGEEITVSFTIENISDVSGTAIFGLDISGDGQTEEIFESEMELDSGESDTTVSDPISFDDPVGFTWEFYVYPADGDTDDIYVATYDMSITEPTYSWGDSYRNDDGLLLTPENIRTLDEYSYEDAWGDSQVHEAPDGEQFAFFDLEVLNDTDGVESTPNRLSFELIVGGSQYNPMSRIDYERDNLYDGLNDIAPDVSEEGVMPYLIPDEYGADDISLLYSTYRDTVIWE